MREWKLLLHESGLSGSSINYSSEADGLEFFFAKREGQKNSLTELQKTIEGLEKNHSIQGIIKQSARCAFPARRRFIKEQLGLAFNEFCKEYTEWLAQFQGEKLSLVFAAPYMGSPASMFGHIFLRVHKKNSTQPLLDQTIGFEALTENSAGMGYAFKGLVGAFPGIFTVLPYHVKVNQYTNLDSRDLWEYPLSLTPEQILKMLEHLWELQNTYFDYYFFDENCSYHLLSLLEVANPEWELRDKFYFKAIPIDAVKVILEADRNALAPTLRPAIQKKIRERLALLSFKEIDDFYKYRNNLNEAPESASVGLIDSWLDWEQYEKYQSKEKLLDLNSKVNYRLLLLRSKKQNEDSSGGSRTEALPHLGHASSKAWIFAYHEEKKGMGLKLRPAFHEMSDWAQGYLESSSLELFEIQIEAHESAKPRIEHFKLAQVENLAPFDRLAQSISWNIGAAFNKPFEENCFRCLDLSVFGGGGVTLNIWRGSKYFFLTSGEVRAGPRYDYNLKFLPFLRSGFFWDVDLLRLQAEHHLLFTIPSHGGSQIRNFDQRVIASASVGVGNFDLKFQWKRAYLNRANDVSRFDLSLGAYY